MRILKMLGIGLFSVLLVVTVAVPNIESMGLKKSFMHGTYVFIMSAWMGWIFNNAYKRP